MIRGVPYDIPVQFKRPEPDDSEPEANEHQQYRVLWLNYRPKTKKPRFVCVQKDPRLPPSAWKKRKPSGPARTRRQAESRKLYGMGKKYATRSWKTNTLYHRIIKFHSPKYMNDVEAKYVFDCVLGEVHTMHRFILYANRFLHAFFYYYVATNPDNTCLADFTNLEKENARDHFTSVFTILHRRCKRWKVLDRESGPAGVKAFAEFVATCHDFPKDVVYSSYEGVRLFAEKVATSYKLQVEGRREFLEAKVRKSKADKKKIEDILADPGNSPIGRFIKLNALLDEGDREYLPSFDQKGPFIMMSEAALIELIPSLKHAPFAYLRQRFQDTFDNEPTGTLLQNVLGEHIGHHNYSLVSNYEAQHQFRILRSTFETDGVSMYFLVSDISTLIDSKIETPYLPDLMQSNRPEKLFLKRNGGPKIYVAFDWGKFYIV